MIMPFAWEGGAQVIVKLRGWSPDTAGVSTGPGPESKEKEIDKETGRGKEGKKEMNIFFMCAYKRVREKRVGGFVQNHSLSF